MAVVRIWKRALDTSEVGAIVPTMLFQLICILLW